MSTHPNDCVVCGRAGAGMVGGARICSVCLGIGPEFAEAYQVAETDARRRFILRDWATKVIEA